MSQLPNAPAPMSQDQAAQLMALLQRQTPAGAAPALAAPIPSPFGTFGASPQGVPAPTAVLIPIKIPIGQGSVKIMLSFGPEYADPNVLINLLNALGNAGYPVDVYVPKQQGWGGNGGGGGGWNGGGGGYGNRGGFGGGGYNNGGGGFRR